MARYCSSRGLSARSKKQALKDALRTISVVANLMDEDPGTMFEIGYAHALGIPVYGYFENLTPMDRVNLMIAQAVELVFAGPDDVAKYLETGEHTEASRVGGVPVHSHVRVRRSGIGVFQQAA